MARIQGFVTSGGGLRAGYWHCYCALWWRVIRVADWVQYTCFYRFCLAAMFDAGGGFTLLPYNAKGIFWDDEASLETPL